MTAPTVTTVTCRADGTLAGYTLQIGPHTARVDVQGGRARVGWASDWLVVTRALVDSLYAITHETAPGHEVLIPAPVLTDRAAAILRGATA